MVSLYPILIIASILYPLHASECTTEIPDGGDESDLDPKFLARIDGLPEAVKATVIMRYRKKQAEKAYEICIKTKQNTGNQDDTDQSKKAEPNSPGEPTETTKDTPKPIETTKDTPKPIETTKDTPKPIETTKDVPEPIERKKDVPEPIQQRIQSVGPNIVRSQIEIKNENEKKLESLHLKIAKFPPAVRERIKIQLKKFLKSKQPNTATIQVQKQSRHVQTQPIHVHTPPRKDVQNAQKNRNNLNAEQRKQLEIIASKIDQYPPHIRNNIKEKLKIFLANTEQASQAASHGFPKKDSTASNTAKHPEPQNTSQKLIQDKADKYPPHIRQKIKDRLGKFVQNTDNAIPPAPANTPKEGAKPSNIPVKKAADLDELGTQLDLVKSNIDNYSPTVRASIREKLENFLKSTTQKSDPVPKQDSSNITLPVPGEQPTLLIKDIKPSSPVEKPEPKESPAAAEPCDETTLPEKIRKRLDGLADAVKETVIQRYCAKQQRLKSGI